METNDKYIGRILDNRYEILEKIGSGGMAVVYKARCHRLNRFVAIKILKEELAQDTEFRRRFHAESQAVAMLSHPNIVAVYDVSKTDNVDYIVMELIEGITLKQYINRKGLLNWKEALHFSTQIAKALSHAHSRQIIHRDIKPHNIMILKDGSVKVADFGIARLLSTQNTLTQDALGSVHYISPEQAKGGHVDARSDLYSLGVVMYEMLTSRLPFEGESAVSVAIQHISSVPLMPRDLNPDIPVGLEQITMHAMEANLNNRYASADDMLRDLEEFRKNPDIVFTYGSSNTTPSAVPDQSTRVVPAIMDTGSMKPVVQKRTPPPVKSKIRNTPDVYPRTKHKASRTSFLVGMVCIVIAVLVMFLFMWNYVLKDILDPKDETITIPSFVGQNIDDVKDNEEYSMYTFEITSAYSETDPEGQIMVQDPASGRPYNMSNNGKITVKLTVSNGTEKIYMPNVYNIDYRVATQQLDALGLNLVVQSEGVNDDNVTKGFVIEQVPAQGTELTKGGTVYITYSIGPKVEMVTVPGLTGLTKDQAILKLESKELSAKVDVVASDKPQGTVIFQSIDEGEEVAKHTEVVIQVSDGTLITPPPTQAPTPTPTTAPTPTPTPTP